jgi:hypothetical protein
MNDTASVEQVKVPAWAWLVVAMAAGALYLMSLDNGLLLQGLAERFHEFFHDGRHFLGVPCH